MRHSNPALAFSGPDRRINQKSAHGPCRCPNGSAGKALNRVPPERSKRWEKRSNTCQCDEIHRTGKRWSSIRLGCFLFMSPYCFQLPTVMTLSPARKRTQRSNELGLWGGGGALVELPKRYSQGENVCQPLI